MIRVRATQMLQYDLRRVRAGSCFYIKDESEFSAHCMERVDENAVDIHPSDYIPPPFVPETRKLDQGESFEKVVQKKPKRKSKAEPVAEEPESEEI